MPSLADTAAPVLVLLALAGCGRPRAAVVCHNANCAGPVDPSRDDTMAALEASLALERGGDPAIDGIEIDLLWSAADARCLFAHDHHQAVPPPAAEIAARLAAHVQRSRPITRGDGPFYLKLDLRPGVDGRGTEHDDLEARQHVDCALAFLAVVDEARTARGREMRTFLDSQSPRLLRALVDHPSWSGLSAGAFVAVSAGFAVPGLGTSVTLADFDVPLDAVSVHPDWLGAATLGRLRAEGIVLTLWTKSLGPRQLRAIADLEPLFVSTADAELLRRWLDD